MTQAELLPDILRAVVSSVMNVLLMLSLLQPKYSKKTTNIVMACMLAADLSVAIFCYVSGNLTLLAKLDLVLFAVICLAIRPFFKDTFMQWLFSYITVMNISLVVVVVSFVFSRFLPEPVYANTIIRLALFLLLLFLLRYKVRPLYRQVAEHWSIFFYVAAAIFACFAYYIFVSGDIVKTLSDQAIPLLLLVALSVTAYVSIFHAMKTMSREYTLREEALKTQSRQELLRISMDAMAERIGLQEEAAVADRREAHDRRHFNNALLELLRQGRNEEAMDLLDKQQRVKPKAQEVFCENTTVNAAVTYYARLCKREGITFTVALDIPQELKQDGLELSLAVSNLLENAVHACQAMPEGGERFIRFKAAFTGQLFLQIENPYAGNVTFYVDGYPSTTKKGHGTGTKSVRAFVREQNGLAEYSACDGIFLVRIRL